MSQKSSESELEQQSPFVDQWRPITSSFGLIEAPLEKSVEIFLDWKKGLANSPGRIRLERTEIDRRFPEALRALEPFSPGAWRHLFVPTASEWTLVVNSNLPVPDTHSLCWSFAKLYGLTTVTVVSQPHTLNAQSGEGRYGAYLLDLMKGDGSERIVRLHRESSWQFLTVGEPLGFERLERYDAGRKIDRFDQTLLIEYLGHLHAHPFNAAFYDVPGKPVLITEIHENSNTPPFLTLEGLRTGTEDA